MELHYRGCVLWAMRFVTIAIFSRMRSHLLEGSAADWLFYRHSVQIFGRLVVLRFLIRVYWGSSHSVGATYADGFGYSMGGFSRRMLLGVTIGSFLYDEHFTSFVTICISSW